MNRDNLVRLASALGDGQASVRSDSYLLAYCAEAGGARDVASRSDDYLSTFVDACMVRADAEEREPADYFRTVGGNVAAFSGDPSEGGTQVGGAPFGFPPHSRQTGYQREVKDRQLISEAKKGSTARDLAWKHGISEERVQAIMGKATEETEAKESRSVARQRGKLYDEHEAAKATVEKTKERFIKAQGKASASGSPRTAAAAKDAQREFNEAAKSAAEARERLKEHDKAHPAVRYLEPGERRGSGKDPWVSRKKS